jgi:hypothetical protein
MHQKLHADGLTDVRGQIHRLVNPGLAVATLMENRLKNVAVAIGVAIGDVSVLPVEVDRVSAAVPMPEATGGVPASDAAWALV